MSARAAESEPTDDTLRAMLSAYYPGSFGAAHDSWDRVDFEQMRPVYEIARAKLSQESRAESAPLVLPEPQIQARFRGLDAKWGDWLPVLDGTTIQYRVHSASLPLAHQAREACE